MVAPGHEKWAQRIANGGGGGTFIGDSEGGFYSDGAYTAAPLRGVDTAGANSEDEDVDPQEACYAALGTRFLSVRRTLHCAPSASTMASTQALIQAMQLHHAKHSQWRSLLLYTAPTTTVVASMPQEGVIRGLARLETLLTRKNLLGMTEAGNLGAWCWALLGRCREVGEMGSEDVGVLRSMGKSALWVQQTMRLWIGGRRKGERGEEEDGVDGDDYGEVRDEEEKDVKEENNAVAEEARGDSAAEEVIKPDSNSTHPMKIPEYKAEPGPSSDQPAEQPTPPYSPRIQHHQCPEQLPTSDPEHASPATTMMDASSAEPAVPTAPAALGKSSSSSSAADGDGTAVLNTAEVGGNGHGLGRGGQKDGDGDEDDDDDDEPARYRNAVMMLDMVVTVVGEFYGQRDLLDARAVWGEGGT